MSVLLGANKIKATILFAVSTSLLACGSGSGSGGKSSVDIPETSNQQTPIPEIPVDSSPAVLFAPQLEESFWDGLIQQEFSFSINNTGGSVSECFITPELPTGLRLTVNSDTCVISGNTDAEIDNIFEITARNSKGRNSAYFLLSLVKPLKAPKLTADSSYAFKQEQFKKIELPNASDRPISCHATPNLPAGLLTYPFNNTCIIKGSPVEPVAAKNYTITGFNRGGNSSVDITLLVTEAVINPWGAGPNPENYDYTVRMLENVFDSVNPPALISEFNDLPLLIPAAAASNQINSIKLDTGEVLTAPEEIEKLFSIMVDPKSGELSLLKNRGFDFEKDGHFYQLELGIGNQIKTVLVRLYDEQIGTKNEPLKLDTYSEFESFTQGDFKPDAEYPRFENINLPSRNHAVIGLYVELVTDIDASESIDNPFERFDFGGHINGNNHVIKNLHAPDGLLTIVDYGNLPTYGNQGIVLDRGDTSSVKHLGFVDLHTESRNSLIEDTDTKGFNSILSHISINGYLKNNLGVKGDYSTFVNFGPFKLNRTELTSSYVNLYHKAEGGFATSTSAHSQFSGLIASSSLSKSEHVYVNGSVHTQKGALSITFGCHDTYNYTSSYFYCAKGYDTSTYDYKHNGNERERYKARVNMFHGSSLKDPYFEDAMGSGSSSKFRFVTNRADNLVERVVGNAFRDGDAHDGIADEYGCDKNLTDDKDSCLNLERYGQKREQFKKVSNWSGGWIASGRWDYVDGKWPVLTNMPFPHQANSPWVYQKDPGVGYQRYTYNDYLTENKPDASSHSVQPAPTIERIKLPILNDGKAVSILIPVSSGVVSSCYVTEDLPKGLVLELVGGECRLVGIPQTDRLQQSITIFVANSSGASSTQLSFNILPKGPVLKPVSPIVLSKGDSIDLVFDNSGGKIVDCKVTPKIPGVMTSVSGNGCRLVGILQQAIEMQNFTLTGSNDRGDSSINFNLTVDEPLSPPNLSGAQSVTWSQGEIQQLVFTNSADEIENCSVAPALPRGLRLRHDEELDACIIEGTPLEASTNNYQISSLNSGGSSTNNLSIHVLAKAWIGAGPSPYEFDYVGAIRENIRVSGALDFDPAIPDMVRSSIDRPDELIAITNGFPNVITKIRTANTLISNRARIDELFVLNKSPISNQISISKGKAFDFESDDHFYELTLELGTETKKLLVRLYDVQTGESSEVIRLQSYSELKSMSLGNFNLDQELFEVFEPSSNKAHNIANFHFELNNDIDAQESVDDKFKRFNFKGYIDGKRHVINNLHLADGLMSSVDANGVNVKIKNLGFVNLHAQSPQQNLIFISDPNRTSFLENFFISGYLTKEISKEISGSNYPGVYFSPLTLSGVNLKQVYLNIQSILTGGYTSGGANIVKFSSLADKGVGGAYFDNVYINGSVKTERQLGAVNLNASCLTNTPSIFWKVGPIYCAQEYRVTNYADLATGGSGSYLRRRTPTTISMLMSSTLRYSSTLSQQPQHRIMPLNDSATNNVYRFVSDRNYPETFVQRKLGNGLRDITNDGLADDVTVEQIIVPNNWANVAAELIFEKAQGNCQNNESCYPMDQLGRTSLEFQDSSTWSGEWKVNGKWDISDDEWPVLKNMPYLHEEGASWMDDPDPGVGYQRATYNDYLAE